MKSFSVFIKEGGIGFHPNQNASNTLSNPEILAAINSHLSNEMGAKFLTVYIALERVRKVLAPYGASIPGYMGMKPSKGEEVIPVAQFGGAIDNNDRTIWDGKPQPSLIYLYFRWRQDNYGVYCFAQICKSEEEVDALMLGEGINEDHWIQKMHLKKGSFTKQANRAGEPVQKFAHEHEHDKGRTGKRARLAIAFKHMHEGTEAFHRQKANYYDDKAANARSKGLHGVALPLAVQARKHHKMADDIKARRRKPKVNVQEVSKALIDRYKDKAMKDVSIFKKDSHKRIFRRAKGLALANKKS